MDWNPMSAGVDDSSCFDNIFKWVGHWDPRDLTCSRNSEGLALFYFTLCSTHLYFLYYLLTLNMPMKFTFRSALTEP